MNQAVVGEVLERVGPRGKQPTKREGTRVSERARAEYI